MLLGARILDRVVGVNSYTFAAVCVFTEGDNVALTFQLVDLAQDGLRYMPATSSVLQVTIDNLDDARKVTKIATQPFLLDPSIWRVSLGPADAVRGTCSLRFLLTEPGAVVTRGSLDRAIRAWPQAKV